MYGNNNYHESLREILYLVMQMQSPNWEQYFKKQKYRKAVLFSLLII